MTPWEHLLERRKKNIGYLTKVSGFGEPTEDQKFAAVQTEVARWQETKGKKLYSISEEYSVPRGKGINLLRTREPGGRLDGPEYQSALRMYVVTPMDHHDILKAQGIDVSRWERKPTIIHKLIWKIKDWLNSSNPDYEPENRTRLTKEFMEMFSIKEKK